MATSAFRGALLCLALLLLPFALRAHPGIGIVMDSKGNVYYTDLKQVWRIAPDGSKTVAVPNVHTHELYLDAQDNLYGEHLWYEGDASKKWGQRVWRLSPDGKLVDIIAAREAFREDYEDFSFVRDRAGNMYWVVRGSPTVIRRRTPEGKTTDITHGADFRDVRWMTVSPDGVVYLIDAGDLRRVAPDGQATTVAQNLAERKLTQFFVQDRHALMGLWLDAQGNCYVAAYGARAVKKITAHGNVSEAARTSFPWSPTGGMFAPNGDLWLLEYSATNQARAQRIARDGSQRTY